jgi:hypothetical protein
MGGRRQVLLFSIIRSIIILMMKVVSTSEASVNFCEFVRHSIPEANHIHPRRRESLKSYSLAIC